jgi:hypothetical protein
MAAPAEVCSESHKKSRTLLPGQYSVSRPDISEGTALDEAPALKGAGAAFIRSRFELAYPRGNPQREIAHRCHATTAAAP